MKSHLEKLLRRESLSRDEARAALAAMVSGEASAEQVSAMLGALRAKGETAEELAGFVDEMLARAVKVEGLAPPVLDVCGTGGDSAGTFNISTAAALVLASLRIPVAKHGNRSISSRCGSIDVLEALRIPFVTDAAGALAQIRDHQIAFLFAPHFHPSLKSVGAIRKAIGVRTTFNILGPLANPAGATHQVIGVYEPSLTHVVAETVRLRGGRRALVVHSEDGLDELSISAPTRGHLWDGKAISEFSFDPGSLGLRGRKLTDLRGGDAAENARIIERALGDLKDTAFDPHREAIALNAAAGLFARKAAPDIASGYARAREAIAQGVAGASLRKLQGAKA